MISVIIPAFNAEKELAGCLKALQSQSLPPDQIIVVDDGSTDQTFQVANQHKVKVIRQANQGPATARNAGVAAAKGDLILFTDSDCEPEQTWVERMVKPFSNPQVMSVKGSYKTRQTARAARLIQCEFEERYQLLNKSKWIDFVDAHAAAFRKSAFVEIGGFDPGFPKANNEDVDLSYRFAAAGHKMVFVPGAVVYHHHPETFSEYFQLKTGRGYWRMIVYRHHPGKAVRDTYTPQLLKLQILLVYLGLAGLVLGFFLPAFFVFSGVSVVGFMLTILPFFRLVKRLAPDLLFLAPWFILIRAVAFSIGILAGMVGMFWFRFKLNI
jgi:GT2 family glycosyltransferase